MKILLKQPTRKKSRTLDRNFLIFRYAWKRISIKKVSESFSAHKLLIWVMKVILDRQNLFQYSKLGKRLSINRRTKWILHLEWNSSGKIRNRWLRALIKEWQPLIRKSWNLLTNLTIIVLKGMIWIKILKMRKFSISDEILLRAIT